MVNPIRCSYSWCSRGATSIMGGQPFCGKHRRQFQARLFPELLRAAESLLACQWVKETASVQVDELRTIVAKATGKVSEDA